MLLGIFVGAVRGEAVVDGQDGLVGHDVARDAAGDMHRLKALAELAARDHRPARLVAVDDLQQRTEPVNGVPAHPAAGGVGPLARQRHLGPHGALAAGLDDPPGGLQQESDVGVQEVGAGCGHLAQAAVDRVHLLAGIEDVGHIDGRASHLQRQLQQHGDTALHVRRADAPQHIALDAGLGVVAGGHRVGVAGQHQPPLPAQVGAGHQIVADADHVEMAAAAVQRLLDQIGYAGLVETDRRHRYQVGRQQEGVTGHKAPVA